MTLEKILTVDDVAAILQVKPITVREMFRDKRLRAFKIGKAWRTTEAMLQEDLAALAEGRRPIEKSPDTKKEHVQPVPAAPEQKKNDAPQQASKAPPKIAKETVDTEKDDSQQLLF